MSCELNSFLINLNELKSEYKPGDQISGVVVIDLKKTLILKVLKLKIKGKCKVRWNEPSDKNISEFIDFGGNETYFKTDLNLLFKGDDKLILESGLHKFPFEFQLPKCIPNSFDHDLATVKYNIKAIIEKPSTFDYKQCLGFTVKAPLEINSKNSSPFGVDDELQEKVRCPVSFICLKPDNVVLHVQIPSMVYSPGDLIRTMIFLNYKFDNQITLIQMSLKQKLTLFERKHSKKCYNEVRTIKTVVEKGPFPKQSTVTVKLQIPFDVPHSILEYCNLIDIKYELDITTHISGWHTPFKNEYEIVIGEISDNVSQTIIENIINSLRKFH